MFLFATIITIFIVSFLCNHCMSLTLCNLIRIKHGTTCMQIRQLFKPDEINS